MITRLSQVTDEHRATLDPDQWRLLVLAELGNHSELASMPWTRLRELELVPGFRLDASPIVLPEEWLPTSSRRLEGARTIRPSLAAAMPGGSPEAIERREECVRRCMLALWLPPLSGFKRNALAPTTWIETINRLLALVGSASKRRQVPDGTIFSHLTRTDIQAILRTFPEANKRRQRHGSVLRRLAEAGRHGILSDFPSPKEDVEPEGSGLKKLAGTVVPGAKKKAEPGSWQPFPDAFVSDLMSRALWVQEHLADQILDCWAEDMDEVKIAQAQGRGTNSSLLNAARTRIIARFPWEFEGERMTELPFKVWYGGKELSHRLPRNRRELGVWVGLVQALNIHVIAFCTAARKAEIGSATEGSVAWPEDGNWRFVGRTWKLAGRGSGTVRDWPLHPIGVRALEIQKRLARMVPRRRDGDYLWVLARLPGSERCGLRMLSLDYPVTEAVKRLNLSDQARSSRPARRALIQTAMVADATVTLTDERAHLHRWRHTVGRLVARTVVEAPQVLFDLFGHRDHAMTLRYMVADPNIQEDAERIAKESKIVRAKHAICECLAGEASGPAAVPLRKGVAKAVADHGGSFTSRVDELAEAALAAMSGEVGTWSKLDDIAERVTANGAAWNMVRPGVLCTKGLDEFGPCTQGRGVPDPGSCRTTCSHRLERASAKEECRTELKGLLAEFAEARAADALMLVVNLEGQIRANLHRWPDVRADFLRSHDDARAIWSKVTA